MSRKYRAVSYADRMVLEKLDRIIELLDKMAKEQDRRREEEEDKAWRKFVRNE